jgi:hypothetical protein
MPINMPPISTDKTLKNFIDSEHRLMPIEKLVGWKGYAVNASESIRQKFNQIIELFKTGKWTVEDQERVKIKRNFKEIKKITQDWSKALHETSARPDVIKYDVQMRQILDTRLNQMKDILIIALRNKPQDAKLNNLKDVVETEIKINRGVLNGEGKVLNQIKESKSVFEEAAAKARNKATANKNKLYKQHAEKLRAERSKHFPAELLPLDLSDGLDISLDTNKYIKNVLRDLGNAVKENKIIDLGDFKRHVSYFEEHVNRDSSEYKNLEKLKKKLATVERSQPKVKEAIEHSPPNVEEVIDDFDNAIKINQLTGNKADKSKPEAKDLFSKGRAEYNQDRADLRDRVREDKKNRDVDNF